MKLKELLTDDDAVSPVIGVILMVAITVILAAVIASFVLGLGQSAGEATPSISFNEDYDSANSELTVTVQSAGDPVDAQDISLSGEDDVNGDINVNFAGENNGADDATSVTASAGDGGSTLSAGDTLTIEANDGYDLDIVWNSGGGDSSVLRTITGPDA